MEERILELIKKSAQGILTEQEHQSFIQWRKNASAEEVEESLSYYETVAEERTKRYDPPPPQVWRNIKEQIGAETRKGRTIVLYQFLRYAATVACIGILIGYYSFRISPTESATRVSMHVVEAPVGSPKRLQLPDGTIIWMKPGSVLQYPLTFPDNTRKVVLAGEAFFDVAKDPDKPFVIKAKHTITNVLGTSFNIAAFPGDNGVEVTVESGKVNVTDSVTQKSFNLIKGHHLAFSADHAFKLDSINVSRLHHWRNGFLVFENVAAGEVVRELERWYGVTFKLTPATEAKMITLKLRNEPEDVAVNSLSRVLGLNFKRYNKTYEGYEIR